MIGHACVFTVFKYTERSKLTFDTSFECPNPSYSYCKKYTEKEVSLHTVQAYILYTRDNDNTEHSYVDPNDDHILVTIIA